MTSTQATRSSLLGTLQELAEADGPAGREEPVRRLVARHLSPFVRRVRVSPLGSLYAERPSARGARLLLTASLDEAGFIASHVDRAGIAWLHPSGQVDPDRCSGASIRFPGGVRATLGVIPSASGSGALSRMLADFGGDDSPAAVGIGCMGVFDTPWKAERMALSCKAIDGRLGAAVALEVLQRTSRAPNTLLLALTTQGQVRHRSLRAAATELAPAAAVTLGTHPVPPMRTPGCTDVRPGKGPVILLRSARFVAHPGLVESLRQAAVRGRIPVQLAVAEEDTTGAAKVCSSLEGIPTAALLVPCTGIGTPRQQVEIRDLEAVVELLVKLMARPLVL
jgi:putative aminopeptidase FrvX